MNPRKLMAVALCAAACITTTVFAADDFGIESASPVVIVDPVNPQPGMVFNAYSPDRYMNWDAIKESISKLPSQPAVKTHVDKNEVFALNQLGGLRARVGRWEGFLKCKMAATYTFVLSLQNGIGEWDSFSFRVNGKPAIPAGSRQATCDVDLKIGWNKVELVGQFEFGKQLNLTFKPKSSLADPRPIGPKDLFHDQKPEVDW